jgi:rubredoxin
MFIPVPCDLFNKIGLEGMMQMDSYECTVCGYVYDPAKGDEKNQIPPGTAFEDLPDDWLCPLCLEGKEVFEKVS